MLSCACNLTRGFLSLADNLGAADFPNTLQLLGKIGKTLPRPPGHAGGGHG